MTCTDIDECTDGTDNCDVNASCANTDGGFTCTCDNGYTSDGTACTDEDECTLGTDKCDDNATCSNVPGNLVHSIVLVILDSRETVLLVLMTTNALMKPIIVILMLTVPTSLDHLLAHVMQAIPAMVYPAMEYRECKDNTHNCDSAATCTNIAGSFTCACNIGNSGSGLTCSDNDECTDNTHTCDTNASCTNTVGSYTCACDLGWQGDGETCTDFDECAVPTLRNTLNVIHCDVNAGCVNTDGSFECGCNAGDGVTYQHQRMF